MLFKLEHSLPADVNYAWSVIMSEEFFSKSYARSGIERTLLSSEERDGKLYTVIRVKVLEPMPKMAAKVLGTAQLQWTQQQVIDHATHTMHWKINIPNAKQVSAQGTFRLMSNGSLCTRIVDGDVQVKIPIVGRKAEEHVCAKLRKSYEESARFTQEWLQNHPKV